MTGDPEDLRALGKRIRAARKRAGLTIAVLAAKAGVARPSLAMWEGGHRDPGVGGLLRISEALGIPASRLLGERKSKFSPGVEAIAELIAAEVAVGGSDE